MAATGEGEHPVLLVSWLPATVVAVYPIHVAIVVAIAILVVVIIELIATADPVHASHQRESGMEKLRIDFVNSYEGKTSFLTSNYLGIYYLMLNGWLLCWMGGFFG